eukprot:358735-Chlamydomonas_euryale.AAC.7
MARILLAAAAATAAVAAAAATAAAAQVSHNSKVRTHAGMTATQTTPPSLAPRQAPSPPPSPPPARRGMHGPGAHLLADVHAVVGVVVDVHVVITVEHKCRDLVEAGQQLVALRSVQDVQRVPQRGRNFREVSTPDRRATHAERWRARQRKAGGGARARAAVNQRLARVGNVQVFRFCRSHAAAPQPVLVVLMQVLQCVELECSAWGGERVVRGHKKLRVN